MQLQRRRGIRTPAVGWLVVIVWVLAAAAGTAGTLRFGFEGQPDGFIADKSLNGTVDAGPASNIASLGNGCLRVDLALPGAGGVKMTPWGDWRSYNTLSLDIFIPKEAPDDLDVIVYIKDSEYWWYQRSLLRAPDTGRSPGSLQKGKWLQVDLDISERATGWQPAGHARHWHDATFRPKELGIRFLSKNAYEGPVYVDEVVLSSARRGGIGPSPEQPVSQPSLQLTTNMREVGRYKKFEITFQLDRIYENPFDPQQVDVMGHFTAPDGSKIDVPGFYYQDYGRRRTADGYEHLFPVGEPCWKVRFSPKQVGIYRYYVTVEDGRSLRSPEGTFECVESEEKGLVRISKRDPRYFEFENGDFYWPLGTNLRDGGRQAEPRGGTYDMDKYIPAMAAAGETWTRTWMCAWWASIECSERYSSRYHGLGRYNMENAWCLDHALELIENTKNMYVELTLNNHGQLCRNRYDVEWWYNPFFTINGGYLTTPSQFWTDGRAKQETLKRYRYVIARWGYCSRIMSWDMWNEVDLVDAYDQEKDLVVAWHKEMARKLREMDPYKHLIVTHICLYWMNGPEMWSQPEIEYVQADSYWDNIPRALKQKIWDRWKRFGKPVHVIEYGKQYDRWDYQDFRAGLWCSTMLPFAGTASYWYWNFVHDKNLYPHYRAVAAFMKGEDRRGKGLHDAQAAASPEPYQVQAVANDTQADFYVYNWPALKFEPSQVNPVSGVVVTIAGLSDGVYNVEFWDTIKGAVIETRQVTASGGRIQIPLPPIRCDMAGKVRRG